MTIVLATDSFKGCLTSQEVEAALAVVLRAKGKQVLCLPMSDGGDGMLDAFSQAMKGELQEAVVHDPMMRIVKARYAVCPNGTAIIESAQACGLHLMSRDERNPLKATTYGVGEMMTDAVSRGCTEIVMGIGGSATCDGGRGMIEALGDCRRLASRCRVTVACDVDNPLYGERGAACIFAPQKGASPEQVRALDARLRDFARATERAGLATPLLAYHPGAGAAGGAGGSLFHVCGCRRIKRGTADAGAGRL